jgi:tyrosine-protein kinase Etk/Wzc
MSNNELDVQSSLDYKKIFNRLLEFKRLYIFSVVLLLVISVIYNKTTKVLYENQIAILISDKGKSALTSDNNFLQGIPLFSGQVNIDNEIELLKSFSLVKETIQRMDLKASMFTYKKNLVSKMLASTSIIKKSEVYESAPIKIVIDPTQPQATNLNFFIEFIDENSFKITARGSSIYLYNYIDDQIIDVANNVFFENVYKFGEEIKTKYFSFQILKSQYFDKNLTKDNALFFYLNNTNYLAYEYLGNLKVAPISQTASIIKATLRGTSYYRITDFLNTLSSVFLDRNLEKKNNAAASTVSFIDNQISEFKDSLSMAEANLKTFRTNNQVMDLSFQGQQVFTKLEQLETERAALETQKRYYQYLKDYFNKNRDASDLLAPSSMNVVDPILSSLVAELLNRTSERNTITSNNPSSGNILLKDLNIKIDNLKKTILENVTSSLSTIGSSISEIEYRINKLSGQISAMPKTELQLKGIERKFELNSTIYTFLLQKRSEAQIAKASSMPDYEVVEPARAISPSVVSPKSTLNYIIALFFGLFLPTAYVLVIDFFNNKVRYIEDLEAIVSKPILGRVFHNFRKTVLIVAKRPNSSVSESFRSIRTNFQFFNHSGNKQVVLFTSSSSGDGKTFCSINFASALALSGNKTVLLEFDLRRPKVHQEFGSSNMIGISSFLIDKAVIDDIIVPTEIPNLDLISAGPAAPNPAELIASERSAEFIETLKEMYDYIIIDSAPVGIVSETFLLMKYSDVNVFVVRLEHTVKDAVRSAVKSMDSNGFSNFNLLINDLNTAKETFKHQYDNKYYTDKEDGFIKRLFKPSAN